MIQAEDFLSPAVEAGYSFWSGVPCSFLTPFINYVIGSEDLDYVGAASEGEAVGVSFGAHLAGRKSVVICQNSGLGNTVNPLTSLNYPFRVPTLLITTHRGAPGLKDEPQHELMGEITGELLDAMRIPWLWFPDEPDAVAKTLQAAEDAIAETSRPFALVMRKGSVAEYGLPDSEPVSMPPRAEVTGQFTRSVGERIARLDAIRAVHDVVGQSHALVGTTGKIGRELFTVGHQPNHLYVVGGMGTASAIGLGVHLGSRRTRPVTVLDGDGALLMKMGALATVGHYQPEGFVHVTLDNEAHESTGAQATVSSTTDLAGVASACGYRSVTRVDTVEDLAAAVEAAAASKGPAFVHAKVAVGSPPDLPRPDVTPVQVKEQFMEWLAS